MTINIINKNKSVNFLEDMANDQLLTESNKHKTHDTSKLAHALLLLFRGEVRSVDELFPIHFQVYILYKCMSCILY